jgi:hypothetical protein
VGSGSLSLLVNIILIYVHRKTHDELYNSEVETVAAEYLHAFAAPMVVSSSALRSLLGVTPHIRPHQPADLPANFRIGFETTAMAPQALPEPRSI